MRSAPKPANFAQLVDAWDDPEAFAAQCNAYYTMLAAERAAQARDFTEPIHHLEDEQ
jgi:hypothetical protein